MSRESNQLRVHLIAGITPRRKELALALTCCKCVSIAFLVTASRKLVVNCGGKEKPWKGTYFLTGACID